MEGDSKAKLYNINKSLGEWILTCKRSHKKTESSLRSSERNIKLSETLYWQDWITIEISLRLKLKMRRNKITY